MLSSVIMLRVTTVRLTVRVREVRMVRLTVAVELSGNDVRTDRVVAALLSLTVLVHRVVRLSKDLLESNLAI